MRVLRHHTRIAQLSCIKNGRNRGRPATTTLAVIVLISAGTLLADLPGHAQRLHLNVSSQETGNLRIGRSNHTATLLRNGKVLIAGGATAGGYVSNSSELYDPETGKWSETGSLNRPRVVHTATLLPDGRVLVAGGNTTSDPAELYDPDTGTWSEAGALNEAHSGWETATLLPNGTVLLLGIVAEKYHPDTQIWSSVPKLITLRYGHTSTLLPSGKILVVGGIDVGAINDDDPGGPAPTLESAELYDPATETSSTTASLETKPGFHTATLLTNGKVLIAGGHNWPGNFNNHTALYDPGAGTWRLARALTHGREDHTATLLANDNVLVVGGRDGGCCTLAEVELYDASADRWSVIGNLSTSRVDHTATLLPNGRVLIVGGTNRVNGPGLDTAELFDPAAAIAIPKILSASVAGKKLIIYGEDFDQ